ncbi:transmembrane protein 222 isoform X1 [Exaiptasia diaphana]|uniref:Transmembrane protein 222 n=1 Tax=Exaiptasia diaphana TaxID=2652724 RepID=A0A913Y834_EXADI|nr:transmembrane protein 222 isoform X2 [Exaiptasia diaphana]XP_020916622.1 transmembrane protein 222 isoform X1 [Exaiptasia diaphana]
MDEFNNQEYLHSDSMEYTNSLPNVDPKRNRYPFCIVWTPIPLLTWIFPFIGHMGIAMSSGVIRDFAGPYYVSEDCMAFGNPTRYWRLNPAKVTSTSSSWDTAVSSASDEYKHRMHNLCCDNCHSHVAMALNLMQYDKSSSWNMFKLALYSLVFGKFVSFGGFLKTWLPFVILCTGIALLVVLV